MRFPGLFVLGTSALSLSLAIGCGSDDGDSGGGNDGSSSGGAAGATSATGGANAGGTTNTGGTTGAGGDATGGTSSGGTGTAGASGGSDSGNGEVDNPELCPDTAPTAGDECDTGFLSCSYNGTVCNCAGVGPDQGEWDCAECPATQPEEGSECDLPFGTMCSYGNETCGCQGFMDPGWQCNQAPEQFDCPAEMPEDGDECSGYGFCQYEDGGCGCNDSEFNCFGAP